ncbi:MAG TPA: tetratricopeptide repeat protein, partial [Bacteroidota bacterium]|nr:tetratricopeptide repeat protein [Bacteroidota bacterium]
QSMDSAVVHWHAGLIGRADSEFRTAISNDSLRADAHYDLAKCLDQLHQYREARSEYRRARDYDQLRFRTSSDFNQAIISASDGRTVFTVDIEKSFRDHSPDSIIGHSLITEHLHPNSHGAFWMAKEYASMMRSLHLLGNDSEWKMRDTISDDTLWNNRSLTDLDERIAQRRTEILTSGWPFVSQVPTVDPVAANDTLGQIVEHVTRSQWSWTQAHENAADYYLLRHDLAHAVKEYRVIINQFPNDDVETYLKLAKILLDQQKIPELHTILQASLAIQPTLLAYRALGDIALENNRHQEAVLYYEKALSLSESTRDQIENRYMLAQAYFNETNFTQTEKEVLQVLQLKPDYKPAIMLLQ